jgi:hypothetical protein
MCPECRPEPEAPTFTPVAEVSARLYFGCALIVIVVCTGIAVPTSDVDDEYLVGQTLYGLTAAFWVLVPMFLAWPKKHSVDIPFPTLFDRSGTSSGGCAAWHSW